MVVSIKRLRYGDDTLCLNNAKEIVGISLQVKYYEKKSAI
jgi:hypothetical protein